MSVEAPAPFSKFQSPVSLHACNHERSHFFATSSDSDTSRGSARGIARNKVFVCAMRPPINSGRRCGSHKIGGGHHGSRAGSQRDCATRFAPPYSLQMMNAASMHDKKGTRCCSRASCSNRPAMPVCNSYLRKAGDRPIPSQGRFYQSCWNRRLRGRGISAVEDYRVNIVQHPSHMAKTHKRIIKIANTGDAFLDVLREYRDGRQSVQSIVIVEVVRAYRGRRDHLLCDARAPANDFLPYMYDCTHLYLYLGTSLTWYSIP